MVAGTASAATANPAALANAEPRAGAPSPCAAKPTTKAAAGDQALRRPADARTARHRRRTTASVTIASHDPEQVGGQDGSDEPCGQAERRRQRIGEDRASR